MMEVIIQPAQPQDARALTEICIASKRHWKYPERWIQIWLPALTITPEYISENETWMAAAEGKPAGFYSLKRGADGWWLDNLWILPAFIGKGIGGKLFRHALERSRLQGAALLYIEAEPNAVKFYEKMGARQIGEHRGEVDGVPRILPVMEIRL